MEILLHLLEIKHKFGQNILQVFKEERPICIVIFVDDTKGNWINMILRIMCNNTHQYTLVFIM